LVSHASDCGLLYAKRFTAAWARLRQKTPLNSGEVERLALHGVLLPVRPTGEPAA
jgi:hypothetical protein